MAAKGIKKAIQDSLATDPDRFNEAQFSRRENLHALFRYPAMMVPSVQQDLIGIALEHDPTIKTLWDPFVGSGTALMAGMRKGLTCFGQDINPLAVLVAKVKTSAFKIQNLDKKADQLLKAIEGKSKPTSLHSFKNIDKWFTPKSQEQLSSIREAIMDEKLLNVRQFFWVVFAETIRFCSNDRTTTFKLHARPLEEIKSRTTDCFVEFKTKLTVAIQDIEYFSNNASGERENPIQDAKIRLADTRFIQNTDGWPKQFDLAVTSPPYGDNGTTVTYGEYSYLQLQWIDRSDIEENVDDNCIRTTQEIDQQGLGGRREPHITPLSAEALGKISKHFNTHYRRIEKIYGGGRSRKLLNFCNDLYIVTDNISSQVRPSGYMIWTIGNRRIGRFEIPNDLILKDFLRHHKCRLVGELSRDIRNKTMPGRNDAGETMKQEKILIFKNGKAERKI